MAEADSVSIDPHKLGYLPYPAGAVLVRDRIHEDAVGYDAPYLWQGRSDADERDMGRKTLEGSRPHAMAAACWLAHRAIPLSQEGHAKILAASILATREFYAALENASRKAGTVRIAFLNSPHTNVICYLPYHQDCRDLSHADALCRTVAAQLSGGQEPDFIVAQTTMRIAASADWFHSTFVPECAERFLAALADEKVIELTAVEIGRHGPCCLQRNSRTLIRTQGTLRRIC